MTIKRFMRTLLILSLMSSLIQTPSCSNEYVDAQGPVQRSGFWGSESTISDAQVVSIGYTTCRLLGRGLSELQVLGKMAGYLPPVGSEARVVGLTGVRDARRYLCPRGRTRSP